MIHSVRLASLDCNVCDPQHTAAQQDQYMSRAEAPAILFAQELQAKAQREVGKHDTRNQDVTARAQLATCKKREQQPDGSLVELGGMNALCFARIMNGP